ncbi:hypothetical protein LCGC14_2297650, partial [marine sediment metagenome]
FDMVEKLIDNIAYEYGIWDDTYHYFNNRDEAYLRNNFDIAIFSNYGLDIAILVDNKGEIVWSAFADLNNERFFLRGMFNPSELIPFVAGSSKTKVDGPTSRSGIINTTLGPLVFSSYAVLKSDESGDSPGSILFGRFIDKDMIKEVADTVKMDFSAAPINKQGVGHFKQMALSEQYRDSSNKIEWYLLDVNETPILKLTLQLDQRTFTDSILSVQMLTAIGALVFSWLIIIFVLNRSLLRPILTISQHLSQIRSSGDYSARINNLRKDEVGTLSHECDLLIGYIEQQNAIVEDQTQELRRLSYEDGLTLLANRRRLDQALGDNWNICGRDQKPISMLLLDIDYFKKYNDYYGHQLGDLALVAIGRLMQSTISRKSDLAARYGGEEFAFLLPDTDLAGAKLVAEKFKRQLQEEAIPHQRSTVASVLTVSIGIATITPAMDDNPWQLIQNADRALYRAKDEGRDRHAFFQPST